MTAQNGLVLVTVGLAPVRPPAHGRGGGGPGAFNAGPWNHRTATGSDKQPQALRGPTREKPGAARCNLKRK